MSYLSEPTSKTGYGVVKVGDNIQVSVEGIISLAQNLSPNADVSFDEIFGNGVYSGGNLVVTSVTPSAGPGISVANLQPNGSAVSFTVNNTGVLSLVAGPGVNVSAATGNVTVNNTGVLSLVAGPGISISGATGNVTVSATGADLLSVVGTTTSYTALPTDEYIGVSSVAAVTITLPTGIPGRVYYIKDEYGQGSGKITIQPAVGEKIDGKNNYVISVPYQCVAIVFRAGGWWMI